MLHRLKGQLPALLISLAALSACNISGSYSATPSLIPAGGDQTSPKENLGDSSINGDTSTQGDTSKSDTGTTRIASPTRLTPANGTQVAASNSVRISWNAVTNAQGYLIRAERLIPGGGAVSVFPMNDSYPSLFYDLPVIPGNQYKFWVHAYDKNFNTSSGYLPANYSEAAQTIFSIAPAIGQTMNGPLKINPINGRYFMDNSGNPIYLTGAHTWASVQDGFLTSTGTFDYEGFLSFLKNSGHNFTRLWTTELTRMDYRNIKDPSDPVFVVALNPYKRTGPGNANDGLLKFDLNQFDEAYFARLKDRVKRSQEEGIYVSVMLFEGITVDTMQGPTGWNFSPYHRNNNVNSIDGDSNGNGSGRESHTLSDANILSLQKNYVKKVLDTLNEFNNVLYEISNEEPAGNLSFAWENALITYIKNYEQSKAKQHLSGMSCIYGDGNPNLFAGNADWVSPCFNASEMANNPPMTNGAKFTFEDIDHTWGFGGQSDWTWKVFTRGYNPLFMDMYGSHWPLWTPSNDYNRSGALSAMGDTLAYSKKVHLNTLLPKGSETCSTTFCLANSGQEYLIYNPDNTDITIKNLSVGTYTYEWFNTITHTTSQRFTRVQSVAGDYLAQNRPTSAGMLLFLKQ